MPQHNGFLENLEDFKVCRGKLMYLFYWPTKKLLALEYNGLNENLKGLKIYADTKITFNNFLFFNLSMSKIIENDSKFLRNLCRPPKPPWECECLKIFDLCWSNELKIKIKIQLPPWRQFNKKIKFIHPPIASNILARLLYITSVSGW